MDSKLQQWDLGVGCAAVDCWWTSVLSHAVLQCRRWSAGCKIQLACSDSSCSLCACTNASDNLVSHLCYETVCMPCQDKYAEDCLTMLFCSCRTGKVNAYGWLRYSGFARHRDPQLDAAGALADLVWTCVQSQSNWIGHPAEDRESRQQLVAEWHTHHESCMCSIIMHSRNMDVARLIHAVCRWSYRLLFKGGCETACMYNQDKSAAQLTKVWPI